MNRPAARTLQLRLLTGLAGVALVLAGAALTLAAGQVDDPSPPPTPGSPAAAAFFAIQDDTPGPPASPPAEVLGPDGQPQPYWRIKQQEARAEQLRQESVASLGAVAALGGGRDTPEPAAASAGVASLVTTRAVSTGGQTGLPGVWGGTARELADYLLSQNSAPRFTVSVDALAAYYVRFAAEVRLRADVLWAQMLHETGLGAYGGDVDPAQNNYAGIGATGGGAPGVTFPTAEDGVKAHVAHMVAYVFTTDQAPWTNSTVDPRYDNVSPRGVARVLSDLDGRWAVPGVGYGEAIERHVAAINR